MGLDLSCSSVRVSRNSRRLVVHDLFFINPCWDLLMRLLVRRWSTNSSLMQDSMILHTIEVRETGL